MDLALLSKIGTIKQFKPDDFICIENDLGEEMYILLKGKVGVYLNSFVDNALEIATLQPGDFFCEMSLLENMPRSATVVALDEGATVIRIGKEYFYELLTTHKEISFKIMKSLIDRADKMIKQLVTKDKPKAKGYLEDKHYQDIIKCEEQNFYQSIQTDPQKTLLMIKYLSHMIRMINDDVLIMPR